MIYKGFNNDEILNAISNIKEKQISGGGYVIDASSMNACLSYLNSHKLPEIAGFIRLAYDQYAGENLAAKIITIENGKVVSKTAEDVEDIGKLAAFATTAAAATGVTLSIPVVGEVIAAIAVIVNIISFFDNEARNRSAAMKDKLIKQYEANKRYTNFSGAKRNVLRTTGIAMRRLADLMPKCLSPSVNCGVEHLRFELRGQLTIDAAKFCVDLVHNYLQDANFKKFIDDYQLITASVPPEVVKPINTTGTTETSESSKSLLPLLASLAGLYFLTK